MTIIIDDITPRPVVKRSPAVGGEGILDTNVSPLRDLVQQINIAWVAKTLAHLLGPALLILATASSFSPLIAAQVLTAILAGIPVYFTTKRFALKAVVSAAVILVQGVLAWFGPTWGWADPSWQNWIALACSALAAAGVLVVPNGAKFSYHLTTANPK